MAATSGHSWPLSLDGMIAHVFAPLLAVLTAAHSFAPGHAGIVRLKRGGGSDESLGGACSVTSGGPLSLDDMITHVLAPLLAVRRRTAA